MIQCKQNIHSVNVDLHILMKTEQLTGNQHSWEKQIRQKTSIQTRERAAETGEQAEGRTEGCGPPGNHTFPEGLRVRPGHKGEHLGRGGAPAKTPDQTQV